MAGVGGLELRNVVAKYPFERSHRFPGIQPNFGHRDYSRLSCGVEDTQMFSLPPPGVEVRLVLAAPIPKGRSREPSFGNPSAIGWHRGEFSVAYPDHKQRIATRSLRRKMARSPRPSGGRRTRLQPTGRGRNHPPRRVFFPYLRRQRNRNDCRSQTQTSSERWRWR